jgi:hypothetical protein
MDTTAPRVLPRLAAAATVSAALVAGGAVTTDVHATGDPTAAEAVYSIRQAWPKKYTGVGIVVDPPADGTTVG